MGTIVVIGANHAGTAAVNTILSLNPQQKVVVLDADSHISFLGCGMALWIGGQIDGPEGLFYSSQQHLAAKGAEIHMETEVTRIDFDAKTVYAQPSHGEPLVVPYDSLILATGSRPILPPLEGVGLENVQQVKRYEDAEEVIEKLNTQNIQSVAVVGAGYIGVELAEAFRRDGKDVTLIDAADTCLASYYDEPFTKRMQEHLSSHGVTLALGERLERLEGQTRVERVVTTKGSHRCDMAVLALGFTPNASLGKGVLATYQNGAYLVDRHQKTSAPDVYAIGDCAVVYDNAADETSYIALASNAVRSGIVAAHNACGQPIASPGVQGSNGISIWGLNMVSTGLTLKKAKAHGFDALAADYTDDQRPRFMHPNAPVTIRIVYDRASRIILGAQMASECDISMGIHLFSLAIQENVTIDKLKLLDLFFLPHFNQPYNYITMAALGAE